MQAWSPPTTTGPEGPLQTTPSGGTSGPRAGFWLRVGAYLIDAILLGVVNAVLTVTLKGAGYGLALIIGIAYFVALEGGPTGQTLGKRALGIRVVDLSGGGAIGYPRAFIRYIGKIISSIPLLLGFFWMLWDSQKQTWHDKLATTVVVPESAFPVRRD
ncbi:MAG: RDD family protein [Thermoleophilaceae bacterium]